MLIGRLISLIFAIIEREKRLQRNSVKALSAAPHAEPRRDNRLELQKLVREEDPWWAERVCCSSVCDLSRDSEKRRELISKELELTKRIIQTKDTKCYPLWHYRKWLFTLYVALFASHAQGTKFVDEDRGRSVRAAAEGRWTKLPLLELLEVRVRFVEIDSRGTSIPSFSFVGVVELHLQANRAQFQQLQRLELSSVHSCSFIREKPLEGRYPNTHRQWYALEAIRWALSIELELILNAVYTEPDDQSAWYYQKSLFDYLLSSTIYSQDELHTMIENRINEIQELIEVEPDCQMAKDCLKLLEQLL